MGRSGHWLFTVLSSPKTGWVLIIFAVACKAVLAAAFSSYEADKSFYLLLAEHIGEGKGFTIPVTLLSNPGVTENIYLPSAASPLYSVIAAPLLKLFPGNYFLVTLLIETIAWFFLFVLLRKIVLRLTGSPYWANLFVLFAGLFLYSVEISSASKDIPSLALLFLALLQTLRISQPGKKAGFPELAGLSLLYLLPGLMKLTYLPLALLFPLSLLLLAFLRREKRLYRYGSIVFLLAAFLVAGHYFYFHSLEAKTLELYPDYYAKRWTMAKSGNEYAAGFYPENLWVLYPFFPASVLNLDVAGVQVKTHLYSVYHIYAVFLYTLNFTGLAVMIAGFFYLLRKYYRKTISERIFFLMAGTFISLGLIFLLCIMSVRYRAVEYKGSDSAWTFVYESRAFLFPILFLQLCLFCFLFSQKQHALVTKWLRTGLLCLLAAGMLHGAFFVSNKALSLTRTRETPASVNQFITRQSDSTRQANPGYRVWLATELPHLDWYAKLNGQQVLGGLDHLNEPSFQLPPRTILLTALAKEDTSRVRPYLQSGKASLLSSYHDLYFVYRQQP